MSAGRHGDALAALVLPPPPQCPPGLAAPRPRRAEPRFGERVPYVVVHGEPGARLFDMVVPPRALVESRGELRLVGVRLGGGYGG